MTNYKNLSGESGVTAYEYGVDYIRIRFIDGGIYKYSYKSAGKTAIEEMKRLAIKGKGLGTYISQHLREKYEHKESSGT